MRTSLRRWSVTTAVAIILVGATGIATANVLPPRQAGPQPDGTAVTTYGWRVTRGRGTDPARREAVRLGAQPGREVPRDQQRRHPDPEPVAGGDVVRKGAAEYFRTAAPRPSSSDSPGAPDGSKLYAAAGGNDKVRVYTRAGAQLTEIAPITVPKGSFPSGLAISSDGSRLFVANNGSGALSAVDTATGKVLGAVATGPNPFTVGLTADGRTAYVSNWGTNTVSAVDTATMTVRKTLQVGSHPTAIIRNPATGEMLVAVTDADKVVGIAPATDSITRTIDLAPYHNAPVGSSPQGLDITPDGKTLYVANAGNNAVAVVDLARTSGQQDKVAGLIPTGWYPTTVTLTQDGSRLLVTNAKGLGAGPNPGGPQPTNPVVDYSQYVASMIQGTLSSIGVPSRDQLAHYTEQVRANNRFDGAGRQTGPAAVVPARPGDPSPIKHVIYIVKENRTYDQVLGSRGKGDGDPSLNLFGDESAPNHRQLARQFVTLDNFYADGAVSSDGWELGHRLGVQRVQRAPLAGRLQQPRPERRHLHQPRPPTPARSPVTRGSGTGSTTPASRTETSACGRAARCRPPCTRPSRGWALTPTRTTRRRTATSRT